MTRTSSVVTLEVAKQGAIYHGLATLLNQPSPMMQRSKDQQGDSGQLSNSVLQSWPLWIVTKPHGGGSGVTIALVLKIKKLRMRALQHSAWDSHVSLVTLEPTLWVTRSPPCHQDSPQGFTPTGLVDCWWASVGPAHGRCSVENECDMLRMNWEKN